MSCYTCQAQRGDESLFKDWKSSDTVKNGVGYRILPLKNDTLVYAGRVYKEPVDKSIYKNEALFNEYLKLVYRDGTSSSNNNIPYVPVQWRESLEIYLDNHLPKSLNRRFKNYIRQNFTGIPNLKINFTRSKSQANIVFENTTDSVYSIWPGTKSYEYYSKAFPNGLPYDHIKSYQSSNYNGSRNTVLVKINNAEIDDELIAMEKLVHMFYSILTGIRPVTDGDTERLTSFNYQFRETVNPMDLSILKMHYYILWDKSPFYDRFIQLTTTYED